MSEGLSRSILLEEPRYRPGPFSCYTDISRLIILFDFLEELMEMIRRKLESSVVVNLIIIQMRRT
jgi:hypothetical protein